MQAHLVLPVSVACLRHAGFGVNPESKKISLNEKKSIVRFYTAGYAHAIVFYLTNAKNKNLEMLKLSLRFLDSDFLHLAIVDLTNGKTK